MRREHVVYKEKIWDVEAVFYGRQETKNPRIRIGREDGFGGYEWEIVFLNEVVPLSFGRD